MKKMIIILAVYTICIIFPQNASSLVLLRADVKGWASIHLTIQSTSQGVFNIERKEQNGSYISIVKTREKNFTDKTTEKNKSYTYRVSIGDDFSNTEDITTHSNQVLMKNRLTTPEWIYKTKFDTDKYHFLVARYDDNYQQEADNKRNFLLSLLDRYLKEQITDAKIILEIKKILNDCITGHSLITAKPYMEKRKNLQKDTSSIETVSFFLYGIKKDTLQKLIQASLIIRNIEYRIGQIPDEQSIRESSARIEANWETITEPALKLRIKFSLLKKSLTGHIAEEINNARKRKNINSVNVIVQNWGNSNPSTPASGYVFRPIQNSSQSESLFIWQGNVFHMNKLMDNIKNLSAIIVNNVLAKQESLTSSTIHAAVIQFNMSYSGLRLTMQIKITTS